jgi:hypothetical protein
LTLLALGRRPISHSGLARIVARVPAIVAKAEEAALETPMALGGNMTITATELAGALRTPTPIGR